MEGQAREPPSAVVVGVSDGGVARTGEEPYAVAADNATQGRADPCGPLGKRLAVLLLIGLVIGNVMRPTPAACAAGGHSPRRSAEQPGTGGYVYLRELERLPREMVVAALSTRYADAEPQHKLGLAYAMARYGEVDAPFLVSRIERQRPKKWTTSPRRSGGRGRGSMEAIHDLGEKGRDGKELASQGPPGGRCAPYRRRRDRGRHVPHRRSARPGPAAQSSSMSCRHGTET